MIAYLAGMTWYEIIGLVLFLGGLTVAWIYCDSETVDYLDLD